MAEGANLYRTEWTRGRYDDKHRVVINYNLIEGMAYFFEEESAFVIGEPLKTEKIGSIIDRTGLNENDISSFFSLLMNYGHSCQTYLRMIL